MDAHTACHTLTIVPDGDLEMTQARAEVLGLVAASIPVPDAERGNVFVAIDGVDGAGKTVFAEQLAEVLCEGGAHVIRVSIDGFHRLRELRYRQGRDSPQGFWEDSYDYAAFTEAVVAPLRAQVRGSYVTAVHEVDSDRALRLRPVVNERPAIVLVDGVFLLRHELREVWDFSVFLHAPFERSVARLALRDGANPDPAHPSNRRYVEGQRRYFTVARPWERASIVIDHAEPAAPSLLVTPPEL